MEQDPPLMKSKNLFLLLRIVFSCGILYVIFRKLDTNQLKDLIPNIVFLFLTLSFLFVLLDRVLMTYRWQILLKAKSTIIPFFEILRIYFVSSFLGIFLPSSVAPDAMRVYLATKYDCTNACAISSVFLDRIIGFLTFAFVALGSCLVLIITGNSQIISGSMFILILLPFLALLLWALFHGYIVKILERLSEKKYFSSLYRVLTETYRSLVSYKNNILDLLKVTAICFLNHGMFILTVYLITLSLNLHVSVIHLAVYIPLVTLVTMIPISLGGLGVQEGAYVYLLSRSGLSLQESFAVALLIRVVVTLGCLPGFALYLSSGFHGKRIME